MIDSPAPTPQVEILGRLDPDHVEQVEALVRRATEADGVRPLSEHVSLHLRHGGDEEVRNVLVRVDGRLAAYGHLDVTDLVEGASAELVVEPTMRRRGIGSLLVTTLLAASNGRLRLWAHGEHPAAAVMAKSLGFRQVRSLWQMRRSLYAPLPPPQWPAGVTVRTFEVGHDEDAWVDLNARAFDGHPEQGKWTRTDLERRLAEPWFGADGFFLAERDQRLVGFHWTKVHGGHDHAQHGDVDDKKAHAEQMHGHEPIGEVYVVGVDPAEQGRGLGKALTLEGLAHLRALGLPEVMLYVDADNAAAIRVYSDLGFTHWDTDVMFRAP
ncbi:MAG: mycothiol synthase [Candidatus Nanopelagicales bacterium]